MKLIALVPTLFVIVVFTVPAPGQELLQNGDFETLAVSADPPMPTRDAFGNATPINWFRATTADPNRPAVPLTELIGPENGDPADDSDGTGQYSVAMNSASINAHSDWRSTAFVTMP